MFGGITRTRIEVMNVTSKTAVTTTTLGTAAPMGCTRTAATADLTLVLARSIASASASDAAVSTWLRPASTVRLAVRIAAFRCSRVRAGRR
jgi:hypothetical protein